jgi:flagellum-specific ATP synthase
MAQMPSEGRPPGAANLWEAFRGRVQEVPARRAVGRILRVVGLTLESQGPPAKVGDRAEVATPEGTIPAEVVGFRDGRVLLMPLGDARGVAPGARVVADHGPLSVPTGPAVLGRILDGLGRPMDGGPPPLGPMWPVDRPSPPPLNRRPIHQAFATGVRAIDALCTVGRGQRLAIFAGSGVGKSTLLGMILRYAQVDVAVVALVGERGREVRQFVEEILGPQALGRSVVVVATSDQPARVRIRAAQVATTLAEAFRARGLDVLLVVDSLTRYAMALREVGLAVGEPPTARGYTPSVFAELPRLLERAGTDARGSITAFYTVLVEGDDLTEPVTDTVRSIVDGHIVLSRSLAERGHYPAVDPLRSLSRLMDQVTDPDHQQAARTLRRLWSVYEESADLIRIGAYTPGGMPELDEAVRARPELEAFLRQPLEEASTLASTRQRLMDTMAPWVRP